MNTLRGQTALALATLAVLQVLHLLDDLRTDMAAEFPQIALRPQPILGIGGTVLAVFAVRRGARAGRPLALTAAGLVALGFVLSHAIPVETARTKPYWGDGSADPLQWIGVSSILVCCAIVAVLARSLTRTEAQVSS